MMKWIHENLSPNGFMRIEVQMDLWEYESKWKYENPSPNGFMRIKVRSRLNFLVNFRTVLLLMLQVQKKKFQWKKRSKFGRNSSKQSEIRVFVLRPEFTNNTLKSIQRIQNFSCKLTWNFPPTCCENSYEASVNFHQYKMPCSAQTIFKYLIIINCHSRLTWSKYFLSIKQTKNLSK